MELTLEQRKHSTNRVTYWGVFVNLVLAVTKLIGGVIGHSQALFADGLHSLSDLLSDAMVLFAARQSGEDADEDHPYGHARYETIATVALGILLITVAIGIGYEATTRLIDNAVPQIPAVITLWIAGVSIASKEILYHYTRYVGNQIQSKMLLANAWHHRSDAISSIIVFLGLVGAMAGWPRLDSLAALAVAVMIAHIGWQLSRQCIQELVDTGLDPSTIENIRRHILSVNGVRELHMLRSRRMGQHALVDVHILVSPRLSVSEGHHISEAVEYSLKESFSEINDVTVHIDPEDDELNKSSVPLPMREELLTRLQEIWNRHAELSTIEETRLHYLDGKVHIEALMPLSSLDSISDARTIRQKFQQACRECDEIGGAELYFH